MIGQTSDTASRSSTHPPNPLSRSYELWRRAEREVEALKEATPDWDSLSKAEQATLWHGHIEALYPDIHEKKRYACDVCHDGKFLHPVVKGKADYSQHIPCPKCAHWTPEDRQRWLELAGIPPARQVETLVNFRNVEGALDAFEAACAVGYGFYEDEEGRHETVWKILFLYGDHGSGKTHLSRGAMIAAHDRGLRGRYCTVRQLMAQLREAMDSKIQGVQSADGIIATLKQVPFLVLDELGTEDPKSGWQAGVLEDIVNHRYDNLMETVLVTNKDVKDVVPGILSRLHDEAVCRTVWNQAPDYRLKKA